MKIRSGIQAGYTSLAACQKDVDKWKEYADAMELFAKEGDWPRGLAYPPAPTTPPTTPTLSGGYVNGVWVSDVSYICTGGTPPTATPQPPGGGYVGGVWYADRSGIC